MKKTYTAPTAEAIDLFTEDPILSGTTDMGTTEKPGFDGNGGILSNKTIWNYNEGNEK